MDTLALTSKLNSLTNAELNHWINVRYEYLAHLEEVMEEYPDAYRDTNDEINLALSILAKRFK